MSTIDFIQKTIVWTAQNHLGLNDDWVRELLDKGYTLEDRRPKQSVSEVDDD